MLFAGGCATADPSGSECDGIACAVAAVHLDGMPHCLGSVVSNDPEFPTSWILTAKHCVQLADAWDPIDIGRVTVMVRGTRFSVTELRVLGGRYYGLSELEEDLALLRVEGLPMDISGLEVGTASEGERVTAFATMDGSLESVGSTVRTVEPRLIYTEGVTCVGDSGGPLVASDGKLVGVASWRSGPGCEGGVSVFARADSDPEWFQAALSSLGRDGRSLGNSSAVLVDRRSRPRPEAWVSGPCD